MRLFRNVIYLIALFRCLILLSVAYFFLHISDSPTHEYRLYEYNWLPISIRKILIDCICRCPHRQSIDNLPHWTTTAVIFYRDFCLALRSHLNCDTDFVSGAPSFCLLTLFKRFISVWSSDAKWISVPMSAQMVQFKFIFYEWDDLHCRCKFTSHTNTTDAAHTRP